MVHSQVPFVPVSWDIRQTGRNINTRDVRASGPVTCGFAELLGDPACRGRSLPVTYGLADRELWPYWPGGTESGCW